MENSPPDFGELRSLFHTETPNARTWRELTELLERYFELAPDWTTHTALPYARQQLDALWPEHLRVRPARWLAPDRSALADLARDPLECYFLANPTREPRRDTPPEPTPLTAPLPERATLAYFFIELGDERFAHIAQERELTLYSESYGWETRSLVDGKQLASGDLSISREVRHPEQQKLYVGFDTPESETATEAHVPQRKKQNIALHEAGGARRKSLEELEEAGAVWAPDGDHIILFAYDREDPSIFEDGSPSLWVWHIETDQFIYHTPVRGLLIDFFVWVDHLAITSDGRHLIFHNDANHNFDVVPIFASDCLANSELPVPTCEAIERLREEEQQIVRFWELGDRQVCTNTDNKIIVQEGASASTYQLILPFELEFDMEATLSRGRFLTLTCANFSSNDPEPAWHINNAGLCLVWDLDERRFVTYCISLSGYNWEHRPAVYDPDIDAILFCGGDYYAGLEDDYGVYLDGIEVHVGDYQPPHLELEGDERIAWKHTVENCNNFFHHYFTQHEGSEAIGEVSYPEDDPRRTSGQMFRAPATPEAIEQTEARLGVFLEPHYRAFMQMAEGFEQFHTLPLRRVWDLLTLDKLSWGRDFLKQDEAPTEFIEELTGSDLITRRLFEESLVFGVQRAGAGYSVLTFDPKLRNHRGAWRVRMFYLNTQGNLSISREHTFAQFFGSVL